MRIHADPGAGPARTTGAAPRFEFRSWGEVEEIRSRITRLGPPEELAPRIDRDRYLLGPVPEVNAKLRGGRLDVKHRLDEKAGFECWTPAWACRAPFGASAVARLMEELGAPWTTAHPDAAIDEIELIEAVDRHAVLDSVAVTKWRQHFDVMGARAETAAVVVEPDGPTLYTVAIEGEDLDQLEELRESLGLSGHENVAMNLAIARVQLERS